MALKIVVLTILICFFHRLTTGFVYKYSKYGRYSVKNDGIKMSGSSEWIRGDGPYQGPESTPLLDTVHSPGIFTRIFT